MQKVRARHHDGLSVWRPSQCAAASHHAWCAARLTRHPTTSASTQVAHAFCVPVLVEQPLIQRPAPCSAPRLDENISPDATPLSVASARDRRLLARSPGGFRDQGPNRADARQMELTRMLSRSGLAQDLSRNMWQESTNLPLVQCDHPPNLHTLWRTKPDPTGPCWNSTWGTTPLHDRSTTPL